MNIAPTQSANITNLYRQAFEKERNLKDENVIENGQIAKYDTWRTYPVTQEFIKALEDKRNQLVLYAMLSNPAPSIVILAQAEILTKILSETINTGRLD